MTTKRISLERTYKASLADLWALWTTKDGIESWWGPEGFAVTVTSIDLRPGGKLAYVMTAITPEMVAFMKKENMPVAQACSITYREVEPRRRLAYTNLVDFVPGVAAYDADTVVELASIPTGVRMTLAIAPMHDEMWTGRAVAGWNSELGKLEKVLS
jgi:uncharacterized protein YndB with AHSA1/START domain